MSFSDGPERPGVLNILSFRYNCYQIYVIIDESKVLSVGDVKHRMEYGF